MRIHIHHLIPVNPLRQRSKNVAGMRPPSSGNPACKADPWLISEDSWKTPTVPYTLKLYVGTMYFMPKTCFSSRGLELCLIQSVSK